MDSKQNFPEEIKNLYITEQLLLDGIRKYWKVFRSQWDFGVVKKLFRTEQSTFIINQLANEFDIIFEPIKNTWLSSVKYIFDIPDKMIIRG